MLDVKGIKKRCIGLQLFTLALHPIYANNFELEDTLLTTTSMIGGRENTRYYGIASGETIIGANLFRDLFASVRDIVGGSSSMLMVAAPGMAVTVE